MMDLYSSFSAVMTYWLSNQERGQLTSPNFTAPKTVTSQL